MSDPCLERDRSSSRWRVKVQQMRDGILFNAISRDVILE